MRRIGLEFMFYEFNLFRRQSKAGASKSLIVEEVRRSDYLLSFFEEYILRFLEFLRVTRSFSELLGVQNFFEEPLGA